MIILEGIPLNMLKGLSFLLSFYFELESVTYFFYGLERGWRFKLLLHHNSALSCNSIISNTTLTYYFPAEWQTIFDAPVGKEPVALNLGSMGKGAAWVNGHGIGRYWVSFHTPKGTPSQKWYVPMPEFIYLFIF